MVDKLRQSYFACVSFILLHEVSINYLSNYVPTQTLLVVSRHLFGSLCSVSPYNYCVSLGYHYGIQ